MARSPARSARRSRPASSASTRSSTARTSDRRLFSDRRLRSPSRTSTSSSSRTSRRGGRRVANAPLTATVLTTTHPEPLLSLEHAQKSFGAVQALRDGDIELFGGEVHGLVGENGAGKSTLVKVLAGIHRPEAGVMKVGGEVVELRSPTQAQDLGIAVVQQEPMLFPDLNVAENVFMGRHPRDRFGRVDWKR